MRVLSLVLVAPMLMLAACASTSEPSLKVAIAPAAQSARPAKMEAFLGAPTTPPRNFNAMCDRDDDLCESPLLQRASYVADETPALTEDAQLKLLQVVNRQVNQNAREVLDSRSLGVDDRWNRPIRQGSALVGDCEDFAVEKRARLVEAGFPAEALSYAMVYRSDIGLHAILVAHLDSGDFVLDSRTPWVTSWTEAPYTWVKVQSNRNARDWYAVMDQPIRGVSPPTVQLASAFSAGTN
jgi:predicted transglutaminase-like cysteine proteinase